MSCNGGHSRTRAWSGSGPFWDTDQQCHHIQSCMDSTAAPMSTHNGCIKCCLQQILQCILSQSTSHKPCQVQDTSCQIWNTVWWWKHICHVSHQHTVEWLQLSILITYIDIHHQQCLCHGANLKQEQVHVDIHLYHIQYQYCGCYSQKYPIYQQISLAGLSINAPPCTCHWFSTGTLLLYQCWHHRDQDPSTYPSISYPVTAPQSTCYSYLMFPSWPGWDS